MLLSRLTNAILANFADADDVVTPVSLSSETSAHSDVLDGAGANPPAAAATKPTRTEFASPPDGTLVPDDHYGNLAGIANWADANWNGTSNGFGDDCTDFASRAMTYGGGMPENVPISPIVQYSSDAYWFQYTYWYSLTKTSYSWAGAWNLSWGQHPGGPGDRRLGRERQSRRHPA